MENIKLKVNRTLKSLIAILLAFIMAFSILPMLIYAANGDRGLFGDFKYEIIDESLKTIKIIEYNGNARDLTIPQTIIGYEVIEIGVGAFNGCKSLTTVKFPKSLKKIESKFDHTCFGGCENLRSIEFQDGIEEIGECAFQYCSSLLSINRFPKSLKTIGDYAFSNTALKELKFDGFIERINPFVFSNCNIRSLSLPEGTKYISEGAFSGCKYLTTVKFPKSLKTIESKAHSRCFGGCEKLKSIEFQDGIEEIGGYAFQYCKSLDSVNKFPKTLKTIGDYAFANTALKELKFDGFIESINSYVFFNCNISDLIIPEGTKYIEQGAFGDCKLLENLKLPKTIDTISNYAFANCDLLTYVVVPENVYEIQDFAFSECDDLKQIYIPKSVKILGNSFFNKGYDDDKLRKSKIYYQGTKEEWETLLSGTYNNLENIPVIYNVKNPVLIINGMPSDVGANPQETVEITANNNKEFIRWQVIKGKVKLANATAKTTTFKMPDGAVEIKAIYKNNGNNPTKPSKPTSPTVKKLSMHRLYNPNSGEHFYTKDTAEKNHLVSLGWKYEGIGWNAPSTSKTPVYRLYNPNAVEHHYTMKKSERDMLIKAGWSYEGIGWYSDDAKSVPLYRQYNPNAYACNHNYTKSKSENDDLIGLGWKYEGIGWYGIK